jgi:hypothetical protein
MAAFKGLPRDITAAGLINWIDEKRIPPNVIFEFAKKLEEVFKSFERTHANGKVELFDNDAYDLEQLIDLLTLVRSVYRSEQLHESVRPMEGNKAEIILAQIRERNKAEWEDEKTIMEKISHVAAEWKTLFEKKVLKGKFFDAIYEKMKMRRSGELSHEDFERDLDTNGFRTAYKVFAAALAGKEIYDIAVGAKNLAHKGYKKVMEHRDKYVKPFFWDKTLRPAGKAVGSAVSWTMKKTGKVLSVPAKIVAAPFVLAGSILGSAWKWVKEPWPTANKAAAKPAKPAHH